MNVLFESIEDLARQPRLKVASFAANAARVAEPQVQVSDTTGFHIYCDLHLTLPLSAASDSKKATLYLELLEDYAQIAVSLSSEYRNLFIFEVQGERIHLYLNEALPTPVAIEKLIELCSLFTKAAYTIIRPKAGDYWTGFCMAADHGRTVVLATGTDGNDSLLSLGGAANTPASRLARSPQVKAGHLAIPRSLAEGMGITKDVKEHSGTSVWIEIDVQNLDIAANESWNSRAVGAVLANRKQASLLSEQRLITFSAEPLETGAAAVDNPRFIQGFMFRADLHGFSTRVNEAFREGQDAVRNLVYEFSTIMRIPSAFETHLNRPFVRLPWAGDCYNCIFLPKHGEDYQTVRSYLPATLATRWFDLDGQVNKSREHDVARIAVRQKWSLGTAGGEVSQGQFLVANIHSTQRPFLVAAGWGSRRSLDAHNTDGLNPEEVAIHVEDHGGLGDGFRDAFMPWSNSGDYRKASATGLKQAEESKLKAVQKRAGPTILTPTPRPYYAEHWYSR